jgi:hypothetical protein
MANTAKEMFGCPPARYQIRVKGIFRESWSDWLSGMEISTEEEIEGSLVTVMVGSALDQAALRGILCKIWDLNLTILSVSRVDVVMKESE